MPIELKSKKEFDDTIEAASEVRVARSGDVAKVKLRTKRGLFTYKTTTEEADSLVKGVKVPVIEF